jgi:hypothetical protein
MNIIDLMQHAGLNYKAPDAIVDPSVQEDVQPNYRPNRKERRAMARTPGARWDKKLARHYGIPKMFVQHARRHGGSTEMILSELLAQNAIKYKAMPEDQ